MHFLIAFVLLYAALVGFGEAKSETTRIDAVAECLDSINHGTCAGQPAAPARQAGVRPGDRVVAFDGKPVTRWESFTPLVREHVAGPATLTVVRDGRRVDLSVNVVRAERTERDGSSHVIGQIGVTPGETRRYNVFSAVPRTGVVFGRFTTGTLAAMRDIPGQIPKLFQKQPKGKQATIDAGRPSSVIGIGRISGQALEAGSVFDLLLLVASLNVFVGIFNLFPLLPLDGGHLAILGFEQARSGLARLFGRRDPGRVDLRKLMPAMVAFIVVMGSLTLMLVWADITNPIANPFKG
jgi:membrane-associated protease RseP (regulator of RpoE activity)